MLKERSSRGGSSTTTSGREVLVRVYAMGELVVIVVLLVLVASLTSAALLPLWPLLLYKAVWQARWLAGWRRLVREAGDPAARASGLVCVNGRAAPAADGSAVLSPAGGVACAAYWLEIRGGSLSLLRHREKGAVPFVVQSSSGEVAIDPAGAVLLPIPTKTSDLPVPLNHVDETLCQRLLARSITWSTAAPLYLAEERVQFGERCTVVGLAQKPPDGASPYRERDIPTLGSRGTLLVAAMDKQELQEELRRQWHTCLGRIGGLVSATVAGSMVTGLFAVFASELVLCGAFTWTAAFLILGRFLPSLTGRDWPTPPLS
jgi:hypothetical protein